MHVKLFSRDLSVILVIMVILFSGCSRSPSPRYYTLSPMQDLVASRGTGPVQNAVIGIGPVKVADYLDQNLIVTRASDNQLIRADFDRWVGPLKNNFINVLADNIGFLLHTDQIHLYPWRASVPIDFQVAVDVVRCDGRLNDAALLETRWSIFQGPEKKLVKTMRSSISEPVTGADYADLVAAQSRAVGRLSQEIAQAIKGAGKH